MKINNHYKSYLSYDSIAKNNWKSYNGIFLVKNVQKKFKKNTKYINYACESRILWYNGKDDCDF